MTCETCDRLRASLSTAEKERAALERQLSGVHCVCDACPVHAECDHGLPRYRCSECSGIVLLPQTSTTTHPLPPADAAPAAYKAPDSSALEKALGALRAEWRQALIMQDNCGHSMWRYKDTKGTPEFAPQTTACHFCAQLRALLSGGAHVDALKAPKEQKEEEK